MAGEVRRELIQEAGKSRSFRALQAMARGIDFILSIMITY